ncbi:iron-containing alcohol dehydrogenase [Aspergillus candidus]|uniref:Putative Fe-containing alcohol dehydrogenase n=1 Tax=Aspergillus candidus TaxID=41067 RepID=A0A2I2F733_ASPCN|nr:putative Fe-containing alcohol dehydrogenase [Aspergillus candidus]PLB36378.1 putative Fe-containing alcohol dehydrogenase [Aspergillus candidus]
MPPTTRTAFPTQSTPLLTYGLPYPTLTAQHAATTFSAKRIYILISGTLARTTDSLQRLQHALESYPVADMRVVGVRRGMKSHTYWSEVLEVADDVRATGADLLVILGGGTLVDAGKVVGLALANNITTPSALSTFSTTNPNPNPEQEIHPSHLPTIAIPTTLSGGEYSNLAGSTNDTTDEKHLFSTGIRGPQLVILDAELCATTTPARVWLSTGIRAVDHCVETYLQQSSPTGDTENENETEEGEGEASALAKHGLGLLVPGLLKCAADREGKGVEARLDCLLGSVDAMGACLGGGGGAGRGREGVKLGASHGIGHQLGPLGIPHGETSCILLPAVCKYNALHSPPSPTSRQNSLRQFLLRQPAISDVLHARAINKDTADLGDVLDAVIRELGLPRSLSEVGVGREKFDEIAEKSIRDSFCRGNPVPVVRGEQVVEILEMVL